jgi:tetratricopeptide (TPR) repeat protein
MDTNVESAHPWIDAAKTSYPQLLDPEHSLGARLGIINVPMSVWIDEEGMIVRPAEPAFAPRERGYGDVDLPEGTPQRLKDMLAEAAKLDVDLQKTVTMLRDWARNGKQSRYALAPDEVVARSAPRPKEVSLAAANFELGQYLHRAGRVEAARPFFRQAHRLQPENWTYKRQAWSMVDPLQGPTEHYDSDWLTDVRKIGATNYYAKVED